MDVDPRVHALAALFLADVFDEVWCVDLTKWQNEEQRRLLVDRAAAAMQKAIENECEAIRREVGC